MHAFAFTLVTLVAATSSTARPKLSPEEVRLLRSGEVIVEEIEQKKGGSSSVRVLGLVDAKLADVKPVVDNCERFDEFMPRTKESRESGRKGSRSICYVLIKMPFPMKNLWSETDVNRYDLPGGGWRRTWKLRKGTYKRNQGSWTLFPWGKGGRQTLTIYAVDVEPDIIIPNFIVKSAQTSQLPDLFDAVRKRVRSFADK